jgi:hypothetical protein
MIGVVQGLKNLVRFWDVIWEFRWWDYGFQVQVLDKMLEVCEENYGTKSHFKGDGFTLGRIKVIRKYIRLAEEDWINEDEHLAKAMGYYGRNYKRFWD